MSTGEFDRVDKFSSLSLLHAYRRCPRWCPTTTTSIAASRPPGRSPAPCSPSRGPDGLAEVTVELSLKLAEALERIATEQGVAATDLAEVWFVG